MATTTQNREFANEITITDPLDTAIEWIGRNLLPEDVFDEVSLNEWALDRGYVYEK